jgi:hypothetical protein
MYSDGHFATQMLRFVSNDLSKVCLICALYQPFLGQFPPDALVDKRGRLARKRAA